MTGYQKYARTLPYPNKEIVNQNFIEITVWMWKQNSVASNGALVCWSHDTTLEKVFLHENQRIHCYHAVVKAVSYYMDINFDNCGVHY